MSPFTIMTGAIVKGILLTVSVLAVAIVIAVSAFPGMVPNAGGVAVSYSLSGDDVVMTTSAHGGAYLWTVTDGAGESMNTSGEPRIVMTTFAIGDSRFWTLAYDAGGSNVSWPVTDGGYTVELTTADGRCTDWFRLSEGTLWTGFDVSESHGTYTFSDNTGGNGGKWIMRDLLHTAYTGQTPAAKYVGVTYEGESASAVLGPGMYSMSLSVPGPDGSATEYLDYIKVDGQLERSFSWTYAKWSYGGSPAGSPAEFSVAVSFTVEDILRASCYDAAQRKPAIAFMYDGITGTIDPTGVVASLESQLCQLYKGEYGSDADVSGQEYADFILAFVLAAIDYPPGTVGYDTDTYVYGQGEYWALPLQTLYHGMGDCEDTAALCASIYAAAGYETGMGIKPGHAYAIVALDEYVQVSDYTDTSHEGQDYTEFLQHESGGRVFYTCDTHHDGFVLPVGYLCADNIKRTYFVV